MITTKETPITALKALQESGGVKDAAAVLRLYARNRYTATAVIPDRFSRDPDDTMTLTAYGETREAAAAGVQELIDAFEDPAP